MSHRDEVFEQALSLAAEDRVFLADALELSLTGGSFTSADIAAAWNDEIKKRLALYDRGELSADDGDAVLHRLRELLAKRRAEE